MPKPLVCDFCSAEPPEADTWTCPCGDFDTGVPVTARLNASEAGAWLACRRCASLVRSGRREQLVERTLRTAARRFTIPRRDLPTIRRATRELHDDFWAHRQGEPRLLTPDERAVAEALPAHIIQPTDQPLRTAAWVRDLQGER